MSKKRKDGIKAEEKKFDFYSWGNDILREWDLQPRKVKKIRNAYKIKTNRGDKLLKKSSFNDERVLFMYYALEHLIRNGYDYLPRLIPTKYGDLFVKHEGEIYYLADWFDAKECKSKKTDHVYAAVANLAQFHQAARGFTPPNGCVQREKWEEVSAQLVNGCKVLEQKLASLPEEMDKAWDTFHIMARRAQEYLDASLIERLVAKAKEEKTLCHRQYSPKNLVINHNLYIVDWEHCGLGIQVSDLAYFMNKVMPVFDWDVAVGDEIIEAYQKIYTLSEDELKFLGAILTFPREFINLVGKWHVGKIDMEEVPRKLKKILEREKEKVAFLESFFVRYNLKTPVAGEKVNLTSNMWVGSSADYIPVNPQNDIGEISCLLPLWFTFDQEGQVLGQVDDNFMSKANEFNIPVIPMVYHTRSSGEPEKISTLLATSDFRNKLIEEIMKLAETHNFKGVNINFDLDDESDKNNFNVFMESLSNQMRAKNLLTIVSVGAKKGQELYYDYEFLGNVSDYVIIELLDEHVRFPGPVASKNFIDEALKFAQSHIPEEKIIAMFPVYGYQWVGEKNMRQPLGYQEAQKLASLHDSELNKDQESGSLWARFTNEDQENIIWIENRESLSDKVSCIDQYNIAGLAFWRLGLEDSQMWQQERSLNQGAEVDGNFEEEDDDPFDDDAFDD